jgi:hypothetical protein
MRGAVTDLDGERVVIVDAGQRGVDASGQVDPPYAATSPRYFTSKRGLFAGRG